MDNMGDPKNLIKELLHGMKLARQLQIFLHVPSSSSSQETRELLIQKIISTFEKALEMVNWKGQVGEQSQHHPSNSGVANIRISEESPPFSGSPRSEDSDRDLRDQDQNASRKRKNLTSWTRQIRVNPGMGVEGPLDDGYSWRKYGQKDILGAIYPRGYYRCTHRNVQGCLATKQVQRSDKDPNVFEITYRGNHTCTMASSSNNVPTTTSPPPRENQEPNLGTNVTQQNILQSLEHQPNELLSSLRAALRVETENLDAPADHQSFGSSSFHHFPPSTSNIINTEENQPFPSPPVLVAENFTYPDPSSYMSPATSGISHFSMSPPSGVNSFGGGQTNLAASSGSSSTFGLEFSFDQFDGQNFTFDNSPFFS